MAVDVRARVLTATLEYPLPMVSTFHNRLGPCSGHLVNRCLSGDFPSRFGPRQPGQWISTQGAPAWARIIAVDANGKQVEAKPGAKILPGGPVDQPGELQVLDHSVSEF